MNDIEIALQYAQKRKKIRLGKNKIYRRQARAKSQLISYFEDSSDVESESSMITNFNAIKVNSYDEKDEYEDSVTPNSIPMNNENRQTEEVLDDSSSSYDNTKFHDIVSDEDTSDLNLHNHTLTNCFSFCQNLIDFIPKAMLKI
ncbi:unnamed protein product [Rotaria socialis]|nr:unnamed protein product [Rotaria socialis]CAF3608674.1 unnamed protein product [Rotaria socialis]CAF3719312.1 unnamed protein product [Rotaria socialis]